MRARGGSLSYSRPFNQDNTFTLLAMPSSKKKSGKKKDGTTAGVPLLLTSLSALDDDDFDDGEETAAAGDETIIVVNNKTNDHVNDNGALLLLSTLAIGGLEVEGEMMSHARSAVTTTSNDGGGGSEEGEDEKLTSPTKITNGQQTSVLLLALIRLAEALTQLTHNKESNEIISHWRILPPLVKSAYQMLDDACVLLTNTATKYVLVAKAAAKTNTPKTLASSSSTNDNDDSAVNELASELLKGSEMIGAATYILYSDCDCGSSNALRKYIKQYSRGVVHSVVSLVQYFEESLVYTTTTTATTAISSTKDDKDAAAQKAGAIWDACDKIHTVLPRGNRNAIRRDVLNWGKDCNVTIEEFDELLLQSVNKKDCNSNNENDNDNINDNDGMENDDNEIMYTAPEIKIVHASINVIKCSKNVLNLILTTCEYMGAQCVDALLPNTASDDDKYTALTQHNMALCWITNLHALANTIGEGVTELGVLLYPPLDFESTMKTDSDDNIDRKTTTNDNNIFHDNGALGGTTCRLGQTTLGSTLEYQLRSIINVVTCIGNIEFLSNEIAQEALRLKGAVRIRLLECEDAIVIVER